MEAPEDVVADGCSESCPPARKTAPDEIDEYRQDVDEFDGEIASGSEPE